MDLQRADLSSSHAVPPSLTVPRKGGQDLSETGPSPHTGREWWGSLVFDQELERVMQARAGSSSTKGSPAFMTMAPPATARPLRAAPMAVPSPSPEAEAVTPALQKARGARLSSATAAYREAAVGPLPYQALIDSASQRHGVPAGLIAAVMHAESNFNPDARSHAGAMGLMQLMPGTAAGLGVANPWDPAQNIEGGTLYLRRMIERYGGDVSLVLQAYNAGPGAVDRFAGQVPYAETQRYLSRVTELYQRYAGPSLQARKEVQG